MNTDILFQQHEMLLYETGKMREAQNKYFRTRSKEALSEAKQLEAAVDRRMKDIQAIREKLNSRREILSSPTAKELISILKGMNPHAVVCSMEFEGGDPTFSSLEMCNQHDDVVYTDDVGDEVRGDIVAIY